MAIGYQKNHARVYRCLLRSDTSRVLSIGSCAVSFSPTEFCIDARSFQLSKLSI